MLHLDALHLSPHIHCWMAIAAETDGSDGSVGDGDGMLLISASQPALKENEGHESWTRGGLAWKKDSIEITEMCFIGLA